MDTESKVLETKRQKDPNNLRNIEFFSLSSQIPTEVLNQYKIISSNYIENLIMEGITADDYDYPKLQNYFVEHLVKNHHDWYFWLLRPYIVVTQEDELHLNRKSISQILKTSLQPDLFQNLIVLILVQQKLDNFEWIGFLQTPKLRNFQIQINQITILKSLAKFSGTQLKKINIQQNLFTQDELRHSFRARYLRNANLAKKQFTFECSQYKKKMFHLSGFKFRENLGSFQLSSLSSESIKIRMQQKFEHVKNQIQESTYQPDKIQLKKYNKQTKTEKVVSKSVHQIRYLKKSDVSYIATTQDPVWPDEDELIQPLEQNLHEKETGEIIPTDSDQRKVVVNSGSYPFSGLGKIIALFRDPVTKESFFYQEGTAFLIDYKHIMTAAHTLYRRVDKKDPTKGFVRADDFEFFLGPLLLKPLSFVKGQIEHQGEILANGIKAHVLYMDEQFQKSDCQKRQRYDWAVLELELEKQNIRTKQKEKPLKCNFDFDLGKCKDCLVMIASYPRTDTDFETDQQKWKIKKSSKIIRSKEDTSALYFQEMHPIGLSQCKRFLHYEHSVSSGTCGAPLLVLNPQTQRYETIGVHIGRKDKNCGVGLLLLTVSLKSQIESLILQNKHSPIDLKRQYWTHLDYEQEIRNMAVRQEKCLQYKIKLISENGGNNLLDAVAENGVFFPYLHQIKAHRTNKEQSISFFRAMHRFPHLQKLVITSSGLSDQALFELIQQRSKLANLKSINFEGNLITGEGLNILLENSHKFPCLQSINLSKNEIKGENMLLKNSYNLLNLLSINLSFNQITGDGLKALFENCQKMPFLQSINLSDNQITDEGLNPLIENSPKFPCLHSINLKSNKITADGLKALFENGHKFPCLRFINFSDNQISREGLKDLFKNSQSLPFLQKINLSQNEITDEQLQTLFENSQRFPCLESINLSYNKITGEGLLLNNSHKLLCLQSINLRFNKIASEGLKALFKNGQKLPILQTINLQSNKITDDGLKVLLDNGDKFPCLKTIDLWNNQITDKGLQEMLEKQQIFTNLQFVDLWSNRLSVEKWGQKKIDEIKNLRFQVYF